MKLVVLGASAGVELVLRTTSGVRIGERLLSADVTAVPEHFSIEAAAALRRVQLAKEAAPARVERALDRLLRTSKATA